MFKALALAILVLLVATLGIETSASEFVNGRWVDTPKVVLTDWDSIDQLKSFMANDDTDWVRYPDANGVVWFVPSETNDCDDYAARLRDKAEAIGMRLETELLTRYEIMLYQSYLPFDNGELHMLNKAIIGNEIWFVEPQNDNVWLWGQLDAPKAKIADPVILLEQEPEE